MAITLTAAQLAEAVGVDSATATRLLAVASELVNRFAPDAPAAIANEAVIRTAGWLAEQPSAAITSETEGDIRTSYAPMQSALRHSGAMDVALAVEDSACGARYDSAACLEALSQRGGAKAARAGHQKFLWRI